MKNKTIKLENGTTINVYPSSLRNTMINSNDCKTEYERIGNTDVYRVKPTTKQ